MRLVLTIVSLILPLPTAAAVIINEVAWMGSAESANHEWIELHNTGTTALDVTGWQVTDNQNLSVSLDGTIASGRYAVLERTSDESAAGAAFQVYVGALVNTGATLTLKRANGSIADQVAGGENWESIGGDNTTKETAQYTASGWITAAASPGAANATESSLPETSTTTDTAVETGAQTTSALTSSTVRSNRNSSRETVRLELPDVTLQISIDAQTVGYVNQKIAFAAEPSGIGDTLIDSLKYQWNFGDSNVANSKEVSHAFAFPGTYVVTVHGGYARQQQLARHEITILPVTASLTKNSTGDIQVHNDSPYELDISNYTIRGGKEFVFPPFSILLPSQTITIPEAQLAAHNSLVALYDTADSLIASVTPSFLLPREQTVINVVTPEPLVSDTISEPVTPSAFNFSTQAEQKPVSPADIITPVQSEMTPDQATEENKQPSPIPANTLPYIGLILLITVGMVGVSFQGSKHQTN